MEHEKNDRLNRRDFIKKGGAVSLAAGAAVFGGAALTGAQDANAEGSSLEL
jgi:nitrous oxide reductase